MENELRSRQTRRAQRGKPKNGGLPAQTGEAQEVSAGARAERARHSGEAESTGPAPRSAGDLLFPIVGIGASAGGLAAIEQFFAGVPSGEEKAFALVVVQHLDPDRRSMLSDLLSEYTRMPVHAVTDGMTVEAGAAYVIPPNKDMALLKGRLRLTEPSNPRGLRLPIDFFFRSLAQERRERAAAVILSGTGSDGTLGMRAIKEADGLAVVQQPETAQHDGMPRSAIATGLADLVLPPQDMGRALVGYFTRLFQGIPASLDQEAEAAPAPEEPLEKVFALLRAHIGHDFSLYKQNTILRRIERRVAIHQLPSLDAYARYLAQNPAEVATLFRELLIGVTSFFRDPEAFAVLEERVIPALFAKKRSGETLRIWTPGCSTGEEAYSIAILIQEYMTQARPEARVQIFATDIDPDAVDQARAALYPDSIAADISEGRLSHFFTEEGPGFRVKKAIRDMVVFATHNVVEDPPFSRMDLVACRNLLIYMNSDLQGRVLPLFHYALNPMGYLFLGTSETVGEFTDLFTTVDRRWKIYMRKSDGAPRRPPLDFSGASAATEASARRTSRSARQEGRTDIRQALEQTLLSQHTPAAVVVNGEGEVLYVHGRTGYYLEPAEGDASLNVVRMAREGMRVELSTALRKSIITQAKVVQPGLSVRTNGGWQTVNLMVRPMPEPTPSGALYLIVFEQAAVSPPVEPAQDDTLPRDNDQRISVLERDLRAKEEYLQATVEELETSNEELASTNEELQSANEELQSTNEELETSKEELQSVNEELMTVNTELQKKIEELSRLNNDLNNLLAGTGIGTVFVDRGLLIRRFTPAATDIINLIQTDVGRPVSHIVSNLVGYSDLARDVSTVLKTLIPQEREVQLRTGQWYLMRIQPYRTLENVIEGAVLTFVDVTAQKKIQEALQEAQRISVESMFDPAVLLDGARTVKGANEEFLALLGYEEPELIGTRVAEIVRAEAYPRLRDALDEANQGGTPHLALTLLRKDGEGVSTEARLRRIIGNHNSIIMVLRVDGREAGGAIG